MKKKYYLPVCFLLIQCFSFGLFVNGQVYITGPTCVVPGTTYLYNIQGILDTSSRVQLCITGGLISDAGQPCITGTAPACAKVDWYSNTGAGTVTISTSRGVASLNVTISTPLNGGSIAGAIRNQQVDTLTIPGAILCSPATGGACSGTIAYQWQLSDDNVKWTDMRGQTAQNLTMSTALKHNMFYRRKVTQAASGSQVYSDVAAIFVNY